MAFVLNDVMPKDVFNYIHELVNIRCMCFLVYLFKANQNPPISEPFPITPHDSMHAGHFSQNKKSEGSSAPPTSRQPLYYGIR